MILAIFCLLNLVCGISAFVIYRDRSTTTVVCFGYYYFTSERREKEKRQL